MLPVSGQKEEIDKSAQLLCWESDQLELAIQRNQAIQPENEWHLCPATIHFTQMQKFTHINYILHVLKMMTEAYHRSSE